MPTIKQVAKAAGVSVATVSRVLNNSGQVSEELRERVLATVARLNYRPSLVARSLRIQQTQTVAVIVPQLDQPFFSKLTFSIQQALFENAYHTLTCSTMENPTVASSLIDLLLRQRVDGVIIVPAAYQMQDITQLMEAGIAVVLVDRDLPDLSGVDRVMTDNQQGAADAMQHLLNAGHRRIGIIEQPFLSDAIQQRMTGLKMAVSTYPDAVIMQATVNDYHDYFEAGFQTAKYLLQLTPRPTAIFALTDAAAIGAMRSIANMGLRIPEDISIVGFDNVPLAALVNPPLTTVAQPIMDIGQEAARLLMQRIQQPDIPPETVILKNELILRASIQQHTSKT